MKLAIDLRFYSNTPYGLSVYIKNLLQYLIPLLINSKQISKIYLIFFVDLKQDFQENFPNWLKAASKNSKFEIIYSSSKYYSLSEQTSFLKLLNSLKLDLVYFFTFNHPVFYKKSFLYQVLDISQIKTATTHKVSIVYKLKAKIAEYITKQGLKRAKKTLLLGNQTFFDIKERLKIDLNSTNSKIIWAGVQEKYLTQSFSNSNKKDLILKTENLQFDEKENLNWQYFKGLKKIHKPYFLFVSSLKKHKNLPLLISAFENIQLENKEKFQLVVVGSIDPKNQEDLEIMKNSKQFQTGNILHLQNLTDQELIYLQDNCQSYIMPSFSEGFGLTIAEAASRLAPVICSDIIVFKEILQDQAFYFNPNSRDSLIQTMKSFLKMQKTNPEKLSKQTLKAKQIIKKYNWEIVALEIYQEIEKCL